MTFKMNVELQHYYVVSLRLYLALPQLWNKKDLGTVELLPQAAEVNYGNVIFQEYYWIAI